MKKQIILIGFRKEKFDVLITPLEELYNKKYSFIQCDSITEIGAVSQESSRAFLVYVEKDSLAIRKFIWQLKVKFPDAPLILSSADSSIANLAWQSNSVYYLSFPFSRRSLSNMMQRLEVILQYSKPKIKLSYQNGFEIVAPEEICFCEGDGNYTTVYLTNSKKVLLSKKLKDIYLKLYLFPELVRIGKSYIVNIHNITRIDDTEVFFKSNGTLLKQQFSPIYLKRMKENVLWLVS